ncbi:helix-turn-helix domain-containing protein [Streptomyces sp. NPDC048361]|uniref:helix-turn-helix domain-containing protein n=1 Tax=Streptomyces sp. NPDC048361 TaxID=3154720 RepID=UPI0034417E2A
MALQNPSAPPHASSRVPDGTTHSGVIHTNTRHTSRYTVVGNHLAQHRELSLLAIGLAVHIQSLPAGARIGIKVLADRFPEGEARIAAALRELEAHGYLKRSRERLPSGRVVSRTVSCNQPGSSHATPCAPPRARRTASTPPTPRPPRRAAPPPPPLPTAPLPRTEPAPSPEAAELLKGLRRDEPRLLLAEGDVHRLAPLVAAWLDRGADPDAVSRTLTADLPEPLRHPASLLAYRLAALLPPPIPVQARPDPLQNCETCDRAFRGPAPGHCPDCRPDLQEAA